MNILFKDMTPGSIVYALVKNEGLKYLEGSIVSVGRRRVEQGTQNGNSTFPISMPTYKQVVDVTYTLDGKNYTDAVELTASMFPTNKLGGVTLLSTDKDPIIRELHATKKQAVDYVKNAEKEVPMQKKRIKECEALIAEHDTAFTEQQQFETRLQKVEESNKETNDLLKKLLKKIDEKL